MSISLDYLTGNQITALMWRCYLSKFAHLQHSEYVIEPVKTAFSLFQLLYSKGLSA